MTAVDWERVTVRVNAAGRYRWPKGWRRNPAWTRWVYDQQLRVCTGGTVRMTLREGDEVLGAGACHWGRPGWEYRLEGDPDDPPSFLAVHFDLCDAEGRVRLTSSPLPPERLTGLIDRVYLESVLNRVVDSATVGPGQQEPVRTPGFRREQFLGPGRVRATALLTGLLLELDQCSALRSDAVAGTERHRSQAREMQLLEIAHRIADRPGEVPSVEALAREVGCTRHHFCRAFKQLTRLSPQAFIVESRLRHACRLLAATDLPIKAIAADLGYSSEAFFSRQFAAQVGQTATRYRRSRRLNE